MQRLGLSLDLDGTFSDLADTIASVRNSTPFCNVNAMLVLADPNVNRELSKMQRAKHPGQALVQSGDA